MKVHEQHVRHLTKVLQQRQKIRAGRVVDFSPKYGESQKVRHQLVLLDAALAFPRRLQPLRFP